MEAEFEFKFIGWCNEANHDKVWVSFLAEGVPYCAWGKRGAKLQFKQHNTWNKLRLVEKEKQKKYEPVDEFILFSLFPDFKDRVKDELFISTLAGKVR